MKCNQCSANLASGVKFCPECGSKQELKCSNCSASLIHGAKFCPECGFKVTALADSKPAAPTFTLSLAPDALELAPCQVSIQEVTGQGPDGDGELSITVKYQVSNPTDEDWEYLVVRSQLVGSSGQVIDESTDTHEQTISAAESSEFEASFWGVKAQLLGENPSGANVLVNVIACGFLQKKLGEIGIPDVALEAVAIPSGELGNYVNLVSGALWKTEADEEDASCVEVKLLLQNLTDQHIPKVQLIAEIVDKMDRDLFDAGTSEDLLPGDIFLIAGSCYGKDKQLKGAKANLALRAYPAVAAGNCTTSGIAMSSAEESDEDIETHVQQSVVTKENAVASLPDIDELRELFIELEDTLTSKSVLMGVAPSSLVGVMLQPSYFDNDGTEGLQCQITIELTDDEEVDENLKELISDTVSDYLRDNCELEQKLSDLGIDSEVTLWWPVDIARV